jgi:hypothetical protein
MDNKTDFQASDIGNMTELTFAEINMVDGGLSGPATGAVGAGAIILGAAALAVTFPFSGAIGVGLIIGGAINFGVGALSSFGGAGGAIRFARNIF